jgi:hypothetical protein
MGPGLDIQIPNWAPVGMTIKLSNELLVCIRRLKFDASVGSLSGVLGW